MHLADEYAAAGTDAERSQLLAAGRAVIASDMWHGTAAFVGGLLLQGGATLICIVMLWSNVFGRIIAWVGIATHGLDLAHIVVGVFAPGPGLWLMMVAGPLYLVWFPLVGWRLLQLSRRIS